MARPRTAWTTGLALAVTVLFLAGPATAHANLVDAEPRPNSRVDTAPDELELRFSEPLEDTYTRVQVIGPNETDLATETRINADDRHRVTVPLEPLPDGVYTVRWRTLSSADGHTRSGVYLLAVNTSLTSDAAAPADGPGASSVGPRVDPEGGDQGGPGEMLARGLGFAGASLALGLPLFMALANGIQLPGTVERRWSSLAIGGGVLAAVASAGLLALLTVRIDATLATAMSTDPGRNLALRVILFSGAAALMVAGERGPWPHHRWALTGSGTLLAATGLLVTSLGGHAAAGGVGSGLPIAIDWLHQVAVAFWISGVAGLVIAGLTHGISEPAGAALVRRFSPLAVASVVAIVVTGTLASVDRLTSPADLAETAYGAALTAKILLLLPLIALGAYHRYWLLPQLEEPGHKQRDITFLRRSAGLELGLMAVVLLAAGVLTTVSPPVATSDEMPFGSYEAAQGADTPGPYDPVLDESQLTTLSEEEAAGYKLKLLVPGQASGLPEGEQPVWLLLYNEAADEPITDAEITMDAWMLAHGHGTQPEADPTHVSDGIYRGATTWSMTGTWALRFNVTLASGDVLHYAPRVQVGQADATVPLTPPLHSFEDEGYRIDTYVTPEPVTVGAQNLTVQVTPTEAEGFPENAAVVVNLKPPSSPHGEGETLDMTRWRGNAWTTEGPIFVETGTWRVLVALQGKGTYVQDTFELDVQGR